jgi:small subunit ribosomal protein S17
MPRKKDEETVENGAEATEETAVTEETSEPIEAQTGEAEAAETENTEATEETPAKSKKAKSEDATAADASGGGSILDAVVGAVASAVETVASGVASTVTNLVGGSDDKKSETVHGKRAERIGMVTSDKMTKTVVVRVDRLVKHPKYRKYVRKRKQFMAHDELGATIGDKVRIVETRPLSARKRWRVVEIVQKAAK